ncbi:MAG: hypothetical protein ACE5WD_06715 [Candidatus Aminicenantia bacterium]
MKDRFIWNPYTDQPHNIVPKKERFLMHFHHLRSYLSLIKLNFKNMIPVLKRYRVLYKEIYYSPVKIDSQFAVSISPLEHQNEEVVEKLISLGVKNTLIRIPSWETNQLKKYFSLAEILEREGINFVIAILQNRDDVLKPRKWREALNEIISSFYSKTDYFEIGHAWNRTKWGVWDYKEYLRLLEPAVELREKYKEIKLVGPAVIDFEFHLIDAILNYNIFFDKVSSLLYVDSRGAPENTQFGWDTSKKVCLFKAIVDNSKNLSKDCWITEVNWPIKGTGKYSPAAGRPNVSEEHYADYLVRYYLLCLCTGLVERIYWWQLIAPGYGLIDNRGKNWRLRPGYRAYQTMVSLLRGSAFLQRVSHPSAQFFLFKDDKGKIFTVAWTNNQLVDYIFLPKIERIVNQDGKELSLASQRVEINSSPKYIYFDEKEIPQENIELI